MLGDRLCRWSNWRAMIGDKQDLTDFDLIVRQLVDGANPVEAHPILARKTP